MTLILSSEKGVHSLLRKVLVTVVAAMLHLPVMGQVPTWERMKQTQLLVTSDNMFAPYMLDSLMAIYSKSISGTQVKDGKRTGGSMTITDKGVTANLGLASLWRDRVYSAFSFSGTGDDKFVTVLDKGAYGNTLSGGMVLNIFPKKNSIYYDKLKKAIVHERIKGVLSKPYTEAATKQHELMSSAIKGLISYEILMDTFKACIKRKEEIQPLLATDRVVIDSGMAARAYLEKQGLLSKNYTEKKLSEKKEELDRLSTKYMVAYISAEMQIRAAESIQMEADLNVVSFHWLTFKSGYNVSSQPMIRAGDTANFYLGKYNSEYVTASMSYNQTWARRFGKQFQWTISPTVLFSSERQFSKLKMIKISQSIPYTATADSLNIKKVRQSEGYETIAGRKLNLSLDLPLILLWGKSNFGVELAIRGGINDPNGDNLGARVGVYIPFEIKEGTPVWIQPVLRMGRLFSESKMDFLKDNLSFGFNLSVSINNFSIVPKRS